MDSKRKMEETKMEDVKKAYEQIEKTVGSFTKTNPFLRKFYEKEDLVQECFTHFLEKGLFEKYDGSSSFCYFVAVSTKNYLIDMLRKRRLQEVSLSTKIGDEENTELGSMIEEKISDPFARVMLLDLIEKCPDTQCSPNYSLSWKQLLGFVLDGMGPKEIKEFVNISSSRISNLIAELKRDILCIEA